MNKKMTAIGASIAVGTLLLCTAAFAGASGNSGYGTFKTAVENALQAKNTTANVQVTVQDNGKALVDTTAAMKLDETTKAMSGTITVTTDGVTKTTSVYRQSGQMVTKDSSSDVYQVFTQKARGDETARADRDKMDASKIQDLEKVVDALVGNVQDNFTLETNSDGTKTVSLSLAENQVPALANALASLALKNSDGGMHHGMMAGGPAGDQAALQLPVLTDGIKIDSIEMKAAINDADLITGETMVITVSGSDAQGYPHELTINAKSDFSGYGTTVADTVDLTGKNIQQVTHQRGQQD